MKKLIALLLLLSLSTVGRNNLEGPFLETELFWEPENEEQS
jgi:hypothetical protein